MLGLFHYKILTDTLGFLHSIESEQGIANLILENVAQALDCEGGSVFTLRKSGIELRPAAAYGADIGKLREHRFLVGRGVVGWVAAQGEPVLIKDAASDTRFNLTVDGKTGFKTRSIVAAPVTCGPKVLGVLEYLNKRVGSFTAADLELISILASQMGAAIERVRLASLAGERRRLEMAFESLAAGVVVADPFNRVALVNSRAREILETKTGKGDNPHAGDSLEMFAAKWPELARALENVMETPVPICRREVRGPAPKVIGYSCVPIQDHEGTVAGAALLLQDIGHNPFTDSYLN